MVEESDGRDRSQQGRNGHESGRPPRPSAHERDPRSDDQDQVAGRADDPGLGGNVEEDDVRRLLRIETKVGHDHRLLKGAKPDPEDRPIEEDPHRALR